MKDKRLQERNKTKPLFHQTPYCCSTTLENDTNVLNCCRLFCFNKTMNRISQLSKLGWVVLFHCSNQTANLDCYCANTMLFNPQETRHAIRSFCYFRFQHSRFVLLKFLGGRLAQWRGPNRDETNEIAFENWPEDGPPSRLKKSRVRYSVSPANGHLHDG